ncbi:hypothetical protein J2Y68_000673 [Paenarthrobacter nitroguajacolicus]|nr:hypothetical protein [Paenarthrobacter nitroguajacolicus]
MVDDEHALWTFAHIEARMGRELVILDGVGVKE